MLISGRGRFSAAAGPMISRPLPSPAAHKYLITRPILVGEEQKNRGEKRLSISICISLQNASDPRHLRRPVYDSAGAYRPATRGKCPGTRCRAVRNDGNDSICIDISFGGPRDYSAQAGQRFMEYGVGEEQLQRMWGWMDHPQDYFEVWLLI